MGTKIDDFERELAGALTLYIKEIQNAYEVLRDPLKRELYDRYGASGLSTLERGGSGDVRDDLIWKMQSHHEADDINTIFDKLRERSLHLLVHHFLFPKGVYLFWGFRKRQRYLRRVLNNRSKCTLHINCADLYDEYDGQWRFPQLSQASCSQKYASPSIFFS
jgi:DnaJ-class molecular chaperone